MIKTVSFAPPRSAGARSKAAGATPTPVEALRPANPRPASGRTTSKSGKASAQTSLDLFFDAPEEANAPTPELQPLEPQPLEPQPLEKVVAPVENTAGSGGKTPAPSGVKAKRERVPKDLAAQYGEKTVVRAVTPPAEAEVAKKRLSKVERQARRDLIKPSEDLMARLARIDQIAARKPKSQPRGKGWKFVCGRCGTTSYFETPGGLCACGTIAVKE